MSADVIFSGLIGGVLGAVVIIGLYWHSRYSSTKRALVDRLTILLHDVWWNCSESDVFKTWDASLKEILVLHNAFMDFAPPIKKGRVRKAWEQYKGINQEIMKELEGQVFDSKMHPKGKQEFLHKIDSFIKAL